MDMQRHQRRFVQFAMAFALSTSAAMTHDAKAQTVEQFYRGKKISIVIGSSAGGGYDVYARLIAQYFSKYVPGAPQVVPSNMPGAGSNVAAAFIAASAP